MHFSCQFDKLKARFIGFNCSFDKVKGRFGVYLVNCVK